MIGFLAVLITFFPDVFLHGKIFIGKYGDMHTCQFSWAYYFKDTMSKGVFALWNTGSFCGYPFGAGVLSNLSLLNFFVWLIPNAPWAWNVYIMLSLFSVCAFSYLYVREVGYSRSAAFITGLIYTFTLASGHYREDNLGGFLPLSLWCIEKHFKTQKSRYVFFAFLSLVIPTLGVLPQYTLYLCVFFMIYVWVRSRTLAGVAIVALVGGTSAFYLIRLLEFLIHSVRGQLWFVTVLLPSYLVCFVFPHFFESTTRLETNFFFQKIFLEATRSWLHTDELRYIFPPYLSILGLILIAWGWREKGIIRIFRNTAFFILLYLMMNPLIAPITKHIPILAQLPRISRLITLFTFSAAVLAGAGFDRLTNRFFKLKPAVFFFAIFSLSLGGLLLILRFGVQWAASSIRPLLEDYVHEHMLQNPAYIAGEDFYLMRIDDFFVFIKQWTNLGDPSFWMPICFIIFSLVLLKLWQKRFLPRNFFILLACILISVDLLIYFRSRIDYKPTPKEIRFETEGIKFLQRDKDVFRIMQILDEVIPGEARQRSILTPNLSILYGLESAEGYDPLYIGRYQTFFRNFQSDYDKDNAMIFAGPEGNFSYEVADFLNVKYFITSKSKTPKKKLPFVMEDEKIKIYKNPTYFPRAFIVHKAKVIPNDDEILSFLKRDQMDFHTKVVLEEEPNALIDIKDGKSDLDEVVFNTYEPNQIKLTVKASEDGFLVVSNNYYPGWRASLNGKPAKIYRANYTFQAIQIPQGLHQVEFSFRPKSFLIGTVISGLFLILSPFACSVISRRLKLKTTA